MKVIFDTNIYISWVRDRSFEDHLLKRGSIKYISAVVLMELWAGARTKKAARLVSDLQKPYIKAGRVIPVSIGNHIEAGRFLSTLSEGHKNLLKKSDFINDIQIAYSAFSTGATLYTNNKTHFEIINTGIKNLKVEYI